MGTSDMAITTVDGRYGSWLKAVTANAVACMKYRSRAPKKSRAGIDAQLPNVSGLCHAVLYSTRQPVPGRKISQEMQSREVPWDLLQSVAFWLLL
jgi:hypothetical protein